MYRAIIAYAYMSVREDPKKILGLQTVRHRL